MYNTIRKEVDYFNKKYHLQNAHSSFLTASSETKKIYHLDPYT